MIIPKQITFGVPLGTYIKVDRLLLMVVIGMTSSSHVPDSTPMHMLRAPNLTGRSDASKELQDRCLGTSPRGATDVSHQNLTAYVTARP
jgi:hypothetical protein